MKVTRKTGSSKFTSLETLSQVFKKNMFQNKIFCLLILNQKEERRILMKVRGTSICKRNGNLYIKLCLMASNQMTTMASKTRIPTMKTQLNLLIQCILCLIFTMLIISYNFSAVNFILKWIIFFKVLISQHKLLKFK